MTIMPRSASRAMRHATRAIVATAVALPMLLVSDSVASALVVPPVAAPVGNHVTADALPTVQINGVVWDQLVLGNTVYVAGDFSQARPAGSPAGTNQTARANVLAYNLTTGQLITTFVANTNGYVRSIQASPDGSRIYIAGLFTSVNGIAKARIAALNPTTGAVISQFNAAAGYLVYDLVVTNTTVYAGGKFASAGAGSGLVARSNLAAYNATTGAVLPWAPATDDRVMAMAISPNGSTIYAGGMFVTVDGVSKRGIAAIDASSGAPLAWAPVNDLVWAAGPDGAFLDIDVANNAVYAGAYTFGRSAGNLEGIVKYDIGSNRVEWLEDCHGDTYSIFPINGYVYQASHSHFCGSIGGVRQSDDTVTQWRENTRHALSFRDAAAGQLRRDNASYWNFEGEPAPSQTSWAPEWQNGSYTGSRQATWSVSGNTQYVVYGGEFLSVNGVAQQGLTRFAVRAVAPNNIGPTINSSNFAIRVVSPSAGNVRVSFPANFDRDDHELTYELLRNNVVVQSQVVASTHWDRPTVSFFETDLTPGQSLNYRVRVTDSTGNSILTAQYPVTVASSGAPTRYADQVVADGARIYWRLGDAPGSTTALDTAALSNGTVNAFTFGRPGAIVGDPDTAAQPNGTSSWIVQPPLTTRHTGVHTERNASVDDFTLETWFKTSSTQGGVLIGFGNSNTGSSGSGTHDRLMYVSNTGRVLFGVRSRPPGSGVSGSRTNYTIQSQTGLNNNQWHHAVATLSGDGMKLFIDGQQVAARTDVNSGNLYYGYWRVGADSMSGWGSAPTSTRLNGDIDEAAVYYHPLSLAQVQNHWALSGRGAGGNLAPTANFTVSGQWLARQFNGSTSFDDGTIVSYEWNFGDGTTATGVNASRTYETPGTYNVTLTVTDNGGLTGTRTIPVTVTAQPANQPPTASFTAAPSGGLSASFNASASDDPDGTIVSWDWDFGDGSTGSGETTSHPYAAAGTYQVTLTVTDNSTAATSITQPVTVSEAAVFATDTFSRTQTNSWGSAEVGGAWTLSAAGSQYSVNGSRGNITHAPGQTRRATLDSTSFTSAAASVDLAWSAAPTGSGVYTNLQLRRQANGSYYQAVVRALPTSTSIVLQRISGGTTTTLSTASIPGLVYTTGSTWRLEFEVDATSPTNLRAKLWNTAGAEPADWQVVGSDATPELQQPGRVAVESYLSGSASGSMVVSFDNLDVRSIGG
jgi:PKD repeat protein